jgi:hypothetical protein
MAWAAQYLLNRLYHQQHPTRDETIRQRHANGERVSDLVEAFGLTPARISQIVRHRR